MTTRSRARHFHATAKALNAAAANRISEQDSVDGVVLSANVLDVDIQAIIASTTDSATVTEANQEPLSTSFVRPVSTVSAEELTNLHEELRWAESKLMHASERLAQAQEARRKDLVALAIMRRELLGSFAAERAWLTATKRYFTDVHAELTVREEGLEKLVENGVHTEQIIHELAGVRVERKLFALANMQSIAQLARVEENESSSEYHVASEAYEREPDGASMRELARLRSLSTKQRREAIRLRTDASNMLEELGMVSGMGEVTAANAFLAAEYEGDKRSAERMDRVRATQFDLELKVLPQVQTAIKAAFKHPVHFMRARRSTR